VRWDAAVRQPVNTVSNLPFALTGAHMLALGVADARAWRRSSVATAELHSELQRFPLFSLANGAAQVWVAAGSLLFHASYTRAGQRADMGAVYTVLLCPTVYVAQRLGLLGPGNAHAPFATALACAGAWFTHNKWRIKSSRVVPALVVLLALLQALWLAVGSGERRAGLRRWLWGPQRRDRPAGMAWPLLLAAVVSIAIAFGTRWLRVVCLCRRLIAPQHRRLHGAGHDAYWLQPARGVPVARRVALGRRRGAVAAVRLPALRAAAPGGRARRRHRGAARHMTHARLYIVRRIRTPAQAPHQSPGIVRSSVATRHQVASPSQDMLSSRTQPCAPVLAVAQPRRAALGAASAPLRALAPARAQGLKVCARYARAAQLRARACTGRALW
jgi:hypothetical protein